MSIRLKIVFIVLPLVFAPLILTGVTAVLAARNGVTSVATAFLQFKAEQLIAYADSQWNLLVSNGLEAEPNYLQASRAAVESFARSLVRSSSERVFAIGPTGTVEMESAELGASPGELDELAAMAAAGWTGWHTVTVAGAERVAHVASFAPFGWTVFVSEESSVFYASTDRILRQTAWILGAALAVALALLLVFARYLTRPLAYVVDAMTEVISTGDLSKRVEVLYADETGRLGHTFNLMSGALEKAEAGIKSYARSAAVAQHKEQKIRRIFQKFVPRDVIERFEANPEEMLVGENRILAVLFSDVRSFTSISESLRPDELVESLNRYFGRMVDVIYSRGGIVDKYIGDAVMALFGAPVRHEDDALQSVRAALEMLDALKEFNAWQESKGRKPFQIGVGIHYGVVTLGNMGSERKMDYTVIGDGVNLASRLEGLTKYYHEPILVTESVQRKASAEFPCRLVDRVVVKGRSGGTGIFTVRRALKGAEKEAWALHEQALARYYDRAFREAAALFGRVVELLPGDECAERFLGRCRELQAHPPGPEWKGLTEMTEK